MRSDELSDTVNVVMAMHVHSDCVDSWCWCWRCCYHCTVGMSASGRSVSVLASPCVQWSATFRTRSTVCTAWHRRQSARRRVRPTSDRAPPASTSSATSSGWRDRGPRYHLAPPRLNSTSSVFCNQFHTTAHTMLSYYVAVFAIVFCTS